MMNTLLSRHTQMPVIMVEEDMALEANRLYLIPPGSVMHVSPGRLHLKPKKPQVLTLPIDIFFSSLAGVYGAKAVGIILSGTGTDGTRGALAIHEAGGFLMAQEPESSKFDGMPRSAIATGILDEVLPAEELPLRLLAHINNEPYQDLRPVLPVTPHSALTNDDIFAEILQLLYQLGGIDFSDYKPATIMRRLERRMQARHTPELHQYLELLESNRDEMLTLRKEMLISVTSFFRDPEAFELLAQKVIAPMVEAAKSTDTIRVWIAGVATGEEAYSIAMLFLEAFEANKCWPTLKVFATDVDHQAIEKAGVGAYRETIAAEISQERLERFFVQRGDSYVIKNDLRQCIVFARQNLLSDPPVYQDGPGGVPQHADLFQTGRSGARVARLAVCPQQRGHLVFGFQRIGGHDDRRLAGGQCQAQAVSPHGGSYPALARTPGQSWRQPGAPGITGSTQKTAHSDATGQRRRHRHHHLAGALRAALDHLQRSA
jgi:two-component system CheB/CheR fusion protein